MAALLPKLTPKHKASEEVAHALQVAASVATSNYTKLFRLYDDAPNESGYIIDHFAERERMSALFVLAKSFVSLSLFPAEPS
jgi:hypothetical protein